MYRLVTRATISLNDKKFEELHNFLQVLGIFLSKALLGRGVSHACAMTISKNFKLTSACFADVVAKTPEKKTVFYKINTICKNPLGTMVSL